MDNDIFGLKDKQELIHITKASCHILD
jgi:hypothetical protein